MWILKFSANMPTTSCFVVSSISNYYCHSSSIPAIRCGFTSWCSCFSPDAPYTGKCGAPAFSMSNILFNISLSHLILFRFLYFMYSYETFCISRGYLIVSSFDSISILISNIKWFFYFVLNFTEFNKVV